MALQRIHRKVNVTAGQHTSHTEQLLLHASVLALALFAAAIHLIG